MARCSISECYSKKIPEDCPGKSSAMYDPASKFAIRMKEERIRYSSGRVAKGKIISQKTISELIGLPSRCIAQYESGERLPSVSSLISIALFYGVSTDYLLGLTDIR